MNCPSCKTAIEAVKIRPLIGVAPESKQWRCIAHTCPHCSSILSVQIDPVALNSDTLSAASKEVEEQLSSVQRKLRELEYLLRSQGKAEPGQ